MNKLIKIKLPTLTIDTSSSYLSIALHHKDKKDIIHKEVNNTLSNNIILFIDELLNKNKITIKEIKTIIYAKGPGSFTGLRIGLGISKAISLVNDIPLVGISTLDVIAYKYISTYENINSNIKYVLSYINARKNELFYAKYHISEQKINFNENIIYNLINIDDIDINNKNTIYIGTTNSTVDKLKSININITADDYFNFANNNSIKLITPANADLLYVRNKIALTHAEQQSKRN